MANRALAVSLCCAAVVVACDPDSPESTDYCVAQACSRLLDAEEFCGALARRLE